MLKYLVILLDDTSVSYCHYPTGKTISRLMSPDTLRKAIHFGMTHNLMIQVVHPPYDIPDAHAEALDLIDHINIGSSRSMDIVVVDNIGACHPDENKVLVLRTTRRDLFDNHTSLIPILGAVERLNIVITDIEDFGSDDYSEYDRVLSVLAGEIARLYKEGKTPQLNLLTDRMMLSEMNNCNAGHESITVAPDGNFYICPAFYHNGDAPCGTLGEELEIPNGQLYRLEYAPICRNCDAWHCRRCIWLNRHFTREVNTPGKRQCVVAHTERNASRRLLMEIRKDVEFLPGHDIPRIDYLDPFENIER